VLTLITKIASALYTISFFCQLLRADGAKRSLPNQGNPLQGIKRFVKIAGIPNPEEFI